MASKAYPGAAWRLCPGITNDGEYYHDMRDNCWSCAPYWREYPACPSCGAKLYKRREQCGYKPGALATCHNCGLKSRVGPKEVKI